MDSAIQRLNNGDLFAQYAFVFINFDLPTTDKSLFFFFRVVAWGFVGLLVFGGVLGGVLGGSSDKSLGGPYKQAVATDNEKCSDIGNDILNSKGSAVDAAIAAYVLSGSYTHAVFWSWWRWSDAGLQSKAQESQSL